MKKKLSESLALTIAEAYNSLNLTHQLCSEIVKDPECTSDIRSDFLRFAAEAKNAMVKIEQRVPKEKREAFLEQIVSKDPAGFNDVRRNWFKINDKQREAIGNAIVYAVAGHDLKLIDLENKNDGTN